MSGTGTASTVRRSGEPATLPLLATKLLPPQPPVQLVPRQRLIELVKRGVGRTPLTLLSAPAGSGKTILAAAWAADPDETSPVAWLTLDDGDNQPGVFWSYVLEALTRHGVIPASTVRPTHAEAVDLAFVTHLGVALQAREEPVVLVLDDVERLKGQQVLRELDLLLRCAGPALRLVLVTRTDPLLPLHRYRLGGTITEIRLRDLAFTAPEVTAMLEAHGVRSPELATQLLLDRTEGWAAGVRLAAMALQDIDASSSVADELAACLGPRDSILAEYLVAEVLQAMPTDVRQFLLRTSVAAELTPGLADALTGRTDADLLLLALARSNAFVQRVQGAPACYRVHPLFRAFLVALLGHESPEDVPVLHRRASQWFATVGEVDEAVHHAVTAGEWTEAARLVVDQLAIGRLVLLAPAGSTLLQRLARMPDGVVTPEAVVVRAGLELAAAGTGDCADALTGLGSGSTAWGPALRASVEVTRTACCAANGDARETLAAARRGLQALDALPAGQAAAHPELRVLVQHAAGCAHLRAGDFDSACGSLVDALVPAAATGCEAARLRCLAMLALAEACRGRLSRAEEIASTARRFAEESGVMAGRRPAAIPLALAWVALERQDLATARQELQLAGDVTETGTDELLASLARLLQVRLRRDRGDRDAARRLLAEDPVPTAWLRPLLTAEGHALDPSVAGAQPTAPTSDDDPDHPLGSRVGIELARAHWHLAHADPRAGRAALLRALRLSEPQAMRRPFAHAAPPVRRLMRTDASVSSRTGWITDNSQSGAHPTAGSGDAAPLVVQPLSPKETEVLSLLSALLTTEEIANRMFISVNTVKTHVRSILRKLSASRRNEAIRRARQLHLI